MAASDASASLRRARAVTKASMPKRPAAEEFRFQEVVDALQGQWGDDIGLNIKISGREATFGDGSGAHSFSQVDGALVLRGARLTGTAAAPVWEFPDGVVRRWASLKVLGNEDLDWHGVFWRYKGARLELRRQLQAALETCDFGKASSLRAAWKEHQVPEGATPGQSKRLAVGQDLVTGMVVRHKMHSYRGVLLACEPHCTAPASWRAAMGVPSLTRGDEQPFYHCLVDERDRPGGQLTFVAEENLLPCDHSFPVQAPMTQQLLVPCEELGGYLPAAKLERALQRFGKGPGFLL